MKYAIYLFVFLVVSVNAQSYKIKGNISTSSEPVKNASITFTNINDVTQKYSTFSDSFGSYQLSIITSINSNDNNHPVKFELKQNYPNPFSATTTITYKLKLQSNVKVTIYDILGRVVKKFSVGAQSLGHHNVVWDGKNNFGETIAPGVYFYRLQANDESQIKKMVFINNLNNFSIPMSGMNLSASNQVEKASSINIQGNSYTVRIENIENIHPAIVPQEFTNIEIQNDTILNFTVDSQSKAMVYLDSTQQIIRGFGAANILDWRPDMTTAEVNTAFGNGPGQLGFTILRLRIPYKNDAGEFAANVPTAKLAQSLGAIVFASPWTPPPSMKSNNNIVGGYLNESSYSAFADYLKSFADYMASNGVPLYAVSLQNEPDARVNYESCDWNADDFLNFCKNNAASIGTRIMMPESQNFVHALSDPTLNDSAAAANVSIIGGHIYGGGLGPYPLAVSKGKEVWMTEHLDLDDSWTGGLRTGLEINNCMNAGMNAYVWWYIVRFYGPIGEDSKVTKRGYVMSQFSKFIRPGYYRIKSNTQPQKNVYLSAYKDSSSSKLVIVALNYGFETIYQTFSIENGKITSFTPYTTTETENVKQGSSISVTGSSFTAALKPSSITTFVSD